MKPVHSAFGKALRWVRGARGIAQEEFDGVSSRTYVSTLERGVKQPTLTKIDSLAHVMQVHPLTLLTVSYCRSPSPSETTALLARVRAELDELNAAAASKSPSTN